MPPHHPRESRTVKSGVLGGHANPFVYKFCIYGSACMVTEIWGNTLRCKVYMSGGTLCCHIYCYMLYRLSYCKAKIKLSLLN
jgi:hypothetical protein